MNQITTEAKEYIKTARTSVLAVQLLSSAPHASTVHFSYNEDMTEFYFLTNKTYKKSEALNGGEAKQASVVIGFDESEMVTLQMDGSIQIIGDEAEAASARAIHVARNESAHKFDADPNAIMLKFVPTWWRYTNYKAKVKISSED